MCACCSTYSVMIYIFPVCEIVGVKEGLWALVITYRSNVTQLTCTCIVSLNNTYLYMLQYFILR